MSEFYAYSSKLIQLALSCKDLMSYSAFRYKLLVDSSDRKENCAYAVMAKHRHPEEVAALRTQLLLIQELCADLLMETQDV